jgi:hypothetical protein
MGIATDLPARGQIDTVTLEVNRRGESTPLLNYSWDLSGLPAKDFRLPGSFNLYANDGSQPTFDVVVRGLLGDNKVVERRAALGIVQEQDLFVRLGLVGSCRTLGCPPSLTCIEGACKPIFVDVRTLPRFRSELVEHLACDSGTAFLDTSTGTPLPVLGACAAGEHCVEGTCLLDAASLPGTQAFTGGAAELFSDVVPPGAFFEVSALDVPRFFASATTLDDGRVLVVGGYDAPAVDGSAAPVGGAVVYEPLSARFRTIAAPPVALGGHTATKLDGGLVLLVGASQGAPVALLFDPSNDGFSKVAAPRRARRFHSATLLVNKKVLIYGGADPTAIGVATVDSAELFDPATSSWSDTLGPPIRPRAFHAAVALPDSAKRVLMTGGLDSSGVPTSDCEAYDPSTDRFGTEAPLARARAHHTAVAFSDGSVLAVGGEAEPGAPALADAELYVPAGMVTPTQPGVPPLARVLERAIALPGDRVLFVGGAVQADAVPIAAGGAYLYEHAKRAFVLLEPPRAARIGPFATALASGEIVIGGGSGGSGNPAVDGGTDGPPAASAPCDPLQQPGSNGCPPSAPRCTVAGAAGFGPTLTTIGPRCVAAAKTPVLLGGACVPGDAAGADDDCVDTSVCLADTAQPTDLGGAARCQRLCHSDADCTDPQRARCALVLSGPNTDTTGVCMTGCVVGTGAECMPYPGTSCRLAVNIASAGAAQQAAGVCLYDGGRTVMQSCDQLAAATACSSGNLCEGGTCALMCTSVIPCSGMTCVKLVASDPADNGYCQ